MVIGLGIGMEKNLEKDVKNIYNLFWIFIFGSVAGWFIEGLWTFLKKGVLINHSAVAIGPFNIAYGLGAIVLTWLLYKKTKEEAWKLFILGFIGGTILEYIMSVGMEFVLGFSAWNYSAKFWNLNGRVSLLYSVCWGFLAIIWVKVLPIFIRFIKKMDFNIGKKMTYVLIVFLVCDMIFTYVALNRSREEDKGIPPANKFEEILDESFNKEFLQNMFNNNWSE